MEAGFVKKNGTLMFWGEWFGRPMDNYHVVTDSYWEKDNILFIKLSNGEVITIHNPQNITSNETKFYINDASLITFEWFYYGREHTPGNMRRLKYWYIGLGRIICFETDIETGTKTKIRVLRRKKNTLAVEIV